VTATAPTPSIFMVDDNTLAAAAMEQYFSRTGLLRWLGWCPDPAAAVQTIIQIRPDVVLLDVEIPGADCFAALRMLTDQCPDSRVVMFSGHTQFALIDRAFQEGAAGYIIKDDPTATIAQLLIDAAGGECVLSPTASASYLREGGNSA